MSVLELFCAVDDFCRSFEPIWHTHCLANGAKQRIRARELALSEIMTILILFHHSHYRTFNTESGRIVCMATNPKLKLEGHLPPAELQRRYRAAHDASEARRWHALWLFSQDRPIGAVATIVGLHRNSVRALIKRYNATGPAAVSDGRTNNPGSRQPYLTAEQEDTLRAALALPHPDGGRWNGARVARWIAQTTGRKQIYRQFGWVVLRRFGLTLQVPRPRHHQAATPEQQDEWKKN